MKALFVGGVANDSVREVKTIGPDFRYRRSAGDHVYKSQSITQISTGKRWLVYVKGAMPPADQVFAMIQFHNLPDIEEQQNDH